MGLLAVIFDLDGVLVNTDEYHLQSWRKLASQLGLPFDDRTFDTRMRGRARMDALTVFLERSPWPCSPDCQAELAARKDVMFQSIVARRGLTAAPGAPRLLTQLRVRGVKVAVGSSSRNARPILRAIDLDRRVDAVVDGHEAPGKPAPDIFLLAAEKLAVPPSACVVVEDALDGIEAARRAGMAVLAIGPPQRVGHVEHHAATLAEVTVEEFFDIARAACR